MNLEGCPVKVIVGAGSQAAGKRSNAGHQDCRGVLSRHCPERRITRKFISTGKSKSSGRHHTIYAKSKRIEQLRIERVRVSNCNQLPARVVSCALSVEFIRQAHRRAIEHISAGKQVFLPQLVVHSCSEVVFRTYLLSGEGKNYFYLRRTTNRSGKLLHYTSGPQAEGERPAFRHLYVR